MPPWAFPGSLFGVILAPGWRQVGPKVEFWRVGKQPEQKHEKRGPQVHAERDLCSPKRNMQNGSQETLQGLETLHWCPEGTVADTGVAPKHA